MAVISFFKNLAVKGAKGKSVIHEGLGFSLKDIGMCLKPV